jgi:hypothetical protein
VRFWFGYDAMLEYGGPNRYESGRGGAAAVALHKWFSLNHFGRAAARRLLLPNQKSLGCMNHFKNEPYRSNYNPEHPCLWTSIEQKYSKHSTEIHMSIFLGRKMLLGREVGAETSKLRDRKLLNYAVTHMQARIVHCGIAACGFFEKIVRYFRNGSTKFDEIFTEAVKEFINYFKINFF